MERQELQVCGRLSRRIGELEQRLRQLKEMQSRLTAEVDGLPRSASSSSKLERLVAAVVDTERAIEALKSVRLECLLELEVRLKELGDETMQAIMLWRYGFNDSFKQISRKVGYSESRVYQMHRRGLGKWIKL